MTAEAESFWHSFIENMWGGWETESERRQNVHLQTHNTQMSDEEKKKKERQHTSWDTLHAWKRVNIKMKVCTKKMIYIYHVPSQKCKKSVCIYWITYEKVCLWWKRWNWYYEVWWSFLFLRHDVWALFLRGFSEKWGEILLFLRHAAKILLPAGAEQVTWLACSTDRHVEWEKQNIFVL